MKVFKQPVLISTTPKKKRRVQTTVQVVRLPRFLLFFFADPFVTRLLLYLCGLLKKILKLKRT